MEGFALRATILDECEMFLGGGGRLGKISVKLV